MFGGLLSIAGTGLATPNSKANAFRRPVVSSILLILLASCGAFRGSPDTVVDSKQESSDLAPYLKGDVLQKSYSANDADRGGLNPTQWRDAVIAARVEIADQNFRKFKNELYAETTGINLGTDLAALGLTGAASVAGAGTAQALAAASTGILGAGTAFNKDSLFDKTLPALFAQMDANRTSVLITVRKSQQTDVSKYPLSLALSDLNAYERAGSLESAIQGLTTTATDQANANQKTLQNITLTGLTVVPSDVETRKEAYSNAVQTLVNNSDKTSLDKLASAVGATPDPAVQTEALNILVTMDQKANGDQAAAAMSTLCTQLKSVTGQTC